MTAITESNQHAYGYEATICGETIPFAAYEAAEKYVLGMAEPLRLTVAAVAQLLDVSEREAMELLGCDFCCQECGRPADLAAGQTDYYVTHGDESAPFWATGCCSAFFVNASGDEYMGDAPWREEG